MSVEYPIYKSSPIFTKAFDSITAEYPSDTQEVYKTRIGGISGVVQETLTINYTDASKASISDLTRV